MKLNKEKKEYLMKVFLIISMLPVKKELFREIKAKVKKLEG